MTNTEFFRQNAPSTSVAKEFNISKSKSEFVKSNISFNTADQNLNRRSLNPIERVAFSATRRSNKNAYRTEFVLEPQNSDKHKVSKLVSSTVQMPNSIPFLRDIRNVSNQKF